MAKRSLWPREHGAYAQLGAPILAALLLATPTISALLLAVASASAFLANEPLLVVLGHRGPRIRATAGDRAKRRLLALGALTIASAAIGLVLATSETWRMTAVVLVPTSVLLVLVWRRAQHSLVGELVAACTLPAASVPVAVASGVAPQIAGLLWLAWSVGYAASVVAVHRVIARHRRATTSIDRMIALGFAVALVGIGVAAVLAPLLLVALPLVAIAALLAAWPPGANHVRAIGVALVVASVASIGLSIAV